MTDGTSDGGDIPAAGTRQFLNLLKSYEGQPCGKPSAAVDPVNQPMIRHWVEAMGDENPVYVDESAARASVHGQIVAPPTMLQAWGMKGLRATLSPAQTAPTSLDGLMGALDAAGFTSVVATNCEQTYLRYVHLGETLVGAATIESVSEEKQTALGSGHFITTRTDYSTSEGEPVGTMTFRILKFRPKGSGK